MTKSVREAAWFFKPGHWARAQELPFDGTVRCTVRLETIARNRTITSSVNSARNVLNRACAESMWEQLQ